MFERNYDAVKFGKRIKEVRKKNGMTQEQLADALYLSVDSVSRIETGKGMCMPEHVVHLCELFHVSADYLYFGNASVVIGQSQVRNDSLANMNAMLVECGEEDLERLEQMMRLFLKK